MIQRTLTIALLAGALVLAAGCSSSPTSAGYRGDLTPELDSTANSHEQDQNRYARVIDNNTRTAWDDLARVLLLDRNSRLSPYPMP